LWVLLCVQNEAMMGHLVPTKATTATPDALVTARSRTDLQSSGPAACFLGPSWKQRPPAPWRPQARTAVSPGHPTCGGAEIAESRDTNDQQMIVSASCLLARGEAQQTQDHHSPATSVAHCVACWRGAGFDGLRAGVTTPKPLTIVFVFVSCLGMCSRDR
jgi:hypothetical protein